jgi:hypothetical protein
MSEEKKERTAAITPDSEQYFKANKNNKVYPNIMQKFCSQDLLLTITITAE